MKLAVLSDIHGNDIAFEACLSYLKQQDIDAYCLLGDYIGDLQGGKADLYFKRTYTSHDQL